MKVGSLRGGSWYSIDLMSDELNIRSVRRTCAACKIKYDNLSFRVVCLPLDTEVVSIRAGTT